MCFATHLRRNQTHNNTSDASSDPALAQILSVDGKWDLAPTPTPTPQLDPFLELKICVIQKTSLITDNIYKLYTRI